MRLKLVSNNQASERKYSSWIGGSILASLVSISIQFWKGLTLFRMGGAGEEFITFEQELILP